MRSVNRLFIFAMFVGTGVAPTPVRCEEGFATLKQAAKAAPSQVPESNAPLTDLARFIEGGESCWGLCKRAVDAGVDVPPTLDFSDVAQFRPLFRFLVARVRYASQKPDTPMATETLRVLFGLARPFARAEHRYRDDGFLADIYLTTALDQAVPKFDRQSCEDVAKLIKEYVGNWVAPSFERALERNEKRLGREAIEVLRGSGQIDKARARLSNRDKLYRTLYDLLAVKVAIRQHMLDVSHLPETLDDLKGVETCDRFNPERKPFHYRVKDGNYELYSVGPDGHDDGGASRSIVELLGGASGDLVL